MQAQKSKKDKIKNFWKDKRVLLTGGTKGLGKSLATQLHDYGACVAIVSRNPVDRLDIHQDILHIQADVGNKEAIHRITGQAMVHMEGIDVLINNASTLGPTPLGPLIDLTCEDFIDVLEVNLLGPFRLTKTILPFMLLNNEGIIVNISSDAAVSAYPNWGPYSVSKSALDHLSKIWQEELKDTKIKFVTLDPGDMNTDMHLEAIPDADVTQLYNPRQVATDVLQFLAEYNFEKVRLNASEWREFI